MRAALLLFTSLAWAGSVEISAERAVAASSELINARAAFCSGFYLVAWQQDGIRAMRLKAGTLAPADTTPLSPAGRSSSAELPAVSCAGGAFLVAWQDLRAGDYDIRAVLIDARTGEPRGTEIEVAGGPGNQARPAVAADGERFLVVWQEAVEGRSYGIRGVRISPDGRLIDKKPHLYGAPGSAPAAAGAEGQFAVAWAGPDPQTAKSGSVGDRRGSTTGVLVDGNTGAPQREAAMLSVPCGEGIAAAPDGAGGFMTVAGREGYPNPWGWPGPGAVLCSRILAGGATPEAGLNYGPRMSNICARTVPNVVDGATWGKSSKSWDAGEPGGFPGTADGRWPHGRPSVVCGQGVCLFAWVKGVIEPDRLNLSGYTVWLRGLDARTLAAVVPERQVSSAGETQPVLAPGERGEVLLVSLRLRPGAPRQIIARRLQMRLQNR